MPKNTKKTKNGALTLEGVIAKKVKDLSEYRSIEGKSAYVAASKLLKIGRTGKPARIRAPRLRIQKLFVAATDYETTLDTLMNNLMATGNVLLYTKTPEHLKNTVRSDSVGSNYVWKEGTTFSLHGICFRSQSLVVDDCDIDVEDIEHFNSLHSTNFQQIVILKKK